VEKDSVSGSANQDRDKGFFSFAQNFEDVMLNRALKGIRQRILSRPRSLLPVGAASISSLTRADTRL
jgi:hypothetical protein